MKTSKQLIENFKAVVKTGLLVMLLAVSTFLTSCKKQRDEVPNDDQVIENRDEVQADTAAVSQGDKESDNSFLAEAATINMEEIELGKLAQTKAASKDVKDFGKMMVDGHTKSLNELKDLASKKGISLPQDVSEKGKATKDELMKADAKSFDKQYISKMVDGHRDAISKFESARDNSADADVKAWATKTLPDLQMHLDHAQMVQKKVE
jgi:putative membrane protein